MRAGVRRWGVPPPRHRSAGSTPAGLRRDARTMCDDHPTPPPGTGLHQCAVCHADFVVPITVEAVDDVHWHVLLRCGECQTYRDAVITNDVAARYERDLDRGIATIAVAYERLERERMAEDVEVLIAAFRRDLIDAADFARDPDGGRGPRGVRHSPRSQSA